jgi:hypothetical protein
MSKRKGDKQRDQSIRKARHERRESARRAKQEQRKQQKQLAAPAKFTSEYGPDILANCGPQFFCEWGVAQATADAMQRAGRPIPPHIAGALLLDTGATRTCIALKTAIDLGLQPRRMQAGYGAAGKHSNPVFLARLEIKIVDPVTNKMYGFAWEQEVEGIPELHNFAAPLTWQGKTMPVSGLLGRDILRHARIHYDGPAGRMRFEFDVASIQAQPSR